MLYLGVVQPFDGAIKNPEERWFGGESDVKQAS
jgi:hypothetical protein